MEEEAAVTNVLAEACSAGPDYRRELRLLIDFLVVSGLVADEWPIASSETGHR